MIKDRVGKMALIMAAYGVISSVFDTSHTCPSPSVATAATVASVATVLALGGQRLALFLDLAWQG